MIRKSLKAIIASICVITMFSSGMICNADEVNNVMAIANKKSLPSVTTTTPVTTSVTTSMTTSETVATTPIETTIPEVTTSVETTTSTSLETTSQVTTQDTTIQESLITPAVMELPVSNLQPITMFVSDDLLLKLPYEERIVFLQSKIEDYLYSNSVSPDEALEKVQTYLKSICINAELNSKEVLFLLKHAKDITDIQNESIKQKENFYNTLNDIISSANYKNYKGVESYCKNYIKSAFNSGYLSSKETISLTQSIHDTIVKSFDSWDLDLLNFEDYEFISKQSLVTKWNSSYPDMKGWIFIENNPIDYPLMQPFNEDNEYYLQHNWDGSESSRGTIELDYRCSLTEKSDKEDVTQNVLIYGHNLSDNTMFSSLTNYKNKSYWQEHQYIEISTENHQRLYQIYAVCSIYGRTDGTKFRYWGDKYLTMNEETFNEHLKLTKENMYYDTGIVPTFGQDILTLQTCDTVDGWRVVLFAKRVK